MKVILIAVVKLNLRLVIIQTTGLLQFETDKRG